MTITGSRAEHYQALLSGIPCRHEYSFRPEFLPRPQIAGTVPARVMAIGSNKIYAGIDAAGRYRVKFDFDLDEKRAGFESALVRLARPYAGDVYGFHFPLLEGTEVAIAFEGGDPDRPFIAHAMHNGAHTDLVTNRNDTRNIIRTAGLNKIRLEDKRGGNISRFQQSAERDSSAWAILSMRKESRAGKVLKREQMTGWRCERQKA